MNRNDVKNGEWYWGTVYTRLMIDYKVWQRMHDGSETTHLCALNAVQRSSRTYLPEAGGGMRRC